MSSINSISADKLARLIGTSNIVPLEDEIIGATAAALDSGLYVTPLHNHFIRERPSAMCMHIDATADEATPGRAVREIFDVIAAVRCPRPIAHMSFKDPRVIFLHHQEIGKAGTLATVFKRAPDTRKEEAPAGETCCIGEPAS